MFTGLVEETGTVTGLDRRGDGGAVLSIQAELVLEGVRIGDSVAVNGCCLTVTAFAERMLRFDLLAETLSKTNLGGVRAGTLVNLERPLAAGARLGGHFVQGHVDATADVRAVESRGEDRRLEVAVPKGFAHLLAYKGSVAVNGVSLTVAEVGTDHFSVWLIPHTLAATNLRLLGPGDSVNLEFDILAKYLDRMREVRG